MKVTWLGQGGLLFESAEGMTVIVDPYLSNSVEKINPANYRRAPIDDRFLKMQPDVLAFTHDHLDHYDPETAVRYLTREPKMTVLAPESVWGVARKNGGGHNYVQFDEGTVWTDIRGLRFTAVKAVHSDPAAIGIVIEELSSSKKFYVTGDTLYSCKVFPTLPKDIYAVFLPINGVGNNMNAVDATLFAGETGAKYSVPIHFGMFDEGNGTAFKGKNRIIPEIYKEIIFPEVKVEKR